MSRPNAIRMAVLSAAVAGIVQAAISQPFDPRSALAAQQQAYSESLQLFAAHKYGDAETLLESANHSSAGSTGWNMESGVALASAAYHFRAVYDSTTASAIADLAIAHFGAAESGLDKSVSQQDIAVERYLTGRLYEDFRGDLRGALRMYESALAANPANQQVSIAVRRVTAILKNELSKP